MDLVNGKGLVSIIIWFVPLVVLEANVETTKVTYCIFDFVNFTVMVNCVRSNGGEIYYFKAIIHDDSVYS